MVAEDGVGLDVDRRRVAEYEVLADGEVHAHFLIGKRDFLDPAHRDPGDGDLVTHHESAGVEEVRGVSGAARQERQAVVLQCGEHDGHGEHDADDADVDEVPSSLH